MSAKGNATKLKIARAAWRLFNEKGYEETSVDDIVLLSGTSKGSFYHYYNSKDELLSALSDLFDGWYRERLETLDPEMNSFDKLIELSCAIHQMIEDEIPIGLLSMLYSSQVVTKGDKHLLDQNRFYYQMLHDLVDEGQRRGQITSEMAVAEIVWLYSLCERAIIYDYCISDGAYSLGKHTRKVMPMIFGGVREGQ